MANYYTNNCNRYNEERRVLDKLANGERLTAREHQVAYEIAQKNYNYNRHNGKMGRKYKDI